jgi:hypothetical protein
MTRGTSRFASPSTEVGGISDFGSFEFMRRRMGGIFQQRWFRAWLQLCYPVEFRQYPQRRHDNSMGEMSGLKESTRAQET